VVSVEQDARNIEGHTFGAGRRDALTRESSDDADNPQHAEEQRDHFAQAPRRALDEARHEQRESQRDSKDRGQGGSDETRRANEARQRQH